MTASPETQDVLRIVIHIIKTPNDYVERPSKELKWRVDLNEEVLIKSTKRPFEDAAALLVSRGEDPERLYTMRHAHLPYDSFVPMPLRVAAKPGLKRMEAAEKFKAYLADKSSNEEGLSPE